MSYLGGKTFLGKRIAKFLTLLRKRNQTYIEPFVGMCGVFKHMQKPKVGSDLHYHLICLLMAVQRGWLPPNQIDRATWKQLKQGAGSDELRGFAGFFCSYGGNWFSSFAQERKYNRSKGGRRSLIQLRSSIIESSLYCLDYCAWEPLDCLIYCDPPYEGTSPFSKQEVFDHASFWKTIRRWSKTNIVVISEYQAPSDFLCVKQFKVKTRLRSGHKAKRSLHRIEKLFVLKMLASSLGLKEHQFRHRRSLLS